MAAVLGRYARAYAEVAVKNKLNPEKTVAEFQQMADVVNSSRELRNVLQNPAVSREQKLKLLDSIIQHIGASKMLRNFLAVLIDHRRIGNIGDRAGAIQAGTGPAHGHRRRKSEFGARTVFGGKEVAGATTGGDYRQDCPGNIFARSRSARWRFGARGQHNL